MKINSFIYEKLIPILLYGIPQKKGRIFDLRNQKFKNLHPPVFFLSTGRTGTQWFTDILKKENNTLVFHLSKPDLSVQSVYVYNMLSTKKAFVNQDIWQAIKEIFLAGREQNLRYSYKTEKQYIETNNFLTFFAPVLADLFPTSKFVHLYRHPGEFVRSALNRNYYGDNDKNIMRRIKPVDEKYYDSWNNLSQLEKAAWLWNETNQFIENFKPIIHSERIFSLNFNKLSIDKVKTLGQFIGVDIKEKIIRKNIHKRKNVQIKKQFPTYQDWNTIDKNKLKNICGELADKYGYQL